MSTTAKITQADEVIMNKIYLIRGKKVMIDRGLAMLYEVETKRLKEAVRRNESRFPKDFMFEMNKKEFENWRTQNASSNLPLSIEPWRSGSIITFRPRTI